MKLHPLLAIATLAIACAAHPARAQSTASSPVAEPQPLTLPKGVSIEDVKDTGNKAIEKLLSNFAESRHAPGAKGFILLPLPRDVDHAYFSQQLEAELSQRFADKGLKIYTRNDKTLAQIFDFTAWAQNFQEAIDEKTLQKLGGIVDAPAIISPRLDITVDERGNITARANMRVIERRTAMIPPGVSEGYFQMKAMPSNNDILRWSGYTLAGLIALFLLLKFLGAIRAASRPR